MQMHAFPEQLCLSLNKAYQSTVTYQYSFRMNTDVYTHVCCVYTCICVRACRKEQERMNEEMRERERIYRRATHRANNAETGRTVWIVAKANQLCLRQLCSAPHLQSNAKRALTNACYCVWWVHTTYARRHNCNKWKSATPARHAERIERSSGIDRLGGELRKRQVFAYLRKAHEKELVRGETKPW